eukprot:COSAG01_NODE_3688_length_5795_cov_2.922577_7_plen_88_part_00
MQPARPLIPPFRFSIVEASKAVGPGGGGGEDGRPAGAAAGASIYRSAYPSLRAYGSRPTTHARRPIHACACIRTQPHRTERGEVAGG